jgi:hypothetical protein
MKRREAIKAIGAAAIVSQVGLSKPAQAQAVKLRYANASNAGYLANVVMTEYWQEWRSAPTARCRPRCSGERSAASRRC